MLSKQYPTFCFIAATNNAIKQFVGLTGLVAFFIAQMASNKQEDGQRDGNGHCHKRSKEQGDADEEAQHERYTSRDEPTTYDR